MMTIPSLRGIGDGKDLSQTFPPAATVLGGVSMDPQEHLASHPLRLSLIMHLTGVLLVLPPALPLPSLHGSRRAHTGAVALPRASLLLLDPQTPRILGQKVLSSVRAVLPKAVTAPNGQAVVLVVCVEARWVLQPPSGKTATGDGLELSHETQRHVCRFPLTKQKSSDANRCCAILAVVANNSTPPTPQMGRRKLELLPRSTSVSATPSPLASPNPSATSSRSNPFGAAR